MRTDESSGSKRRKLDPKAPTLLMRGKVLGSCRSVDSYEKLNRIDEGSYGIVYRARDKQTGEVVALKKLKLENEKNGFPITSLREIHTLRLAAHPHIVKVKEIVTSSDYSLVFIVMEYLDHDLKALMDSMASPFMLSEVKTLMAQLLSAIDCLHQNWIIHRDLKTSNLLLNNQGQIKVADFGLARRFESPLGKMTELVVTLWYRAPELLMGATEYTTAVDMWSAGCIFGELVTKIPMIQGTGEIDQLGKIFKLVGSPSETTWPGLSLLPNSRTLNFGGHLPRLAQEYHFLSRQGLDLLERLLLCDPERRISAHEALQHPFFSEAPLPKDPQMFPSFPSKSAGERRVRLHSPSAPRGAHEQE